MAACGEAYYAQALSIPMYPDLTESDCRDEVCVAMGEISRPTGWIACLPNRVFVRIVAVGEDEDGEAVDAGAF